jgi:penicillin-binding protein 1A
VTGGGAPAGIWHDFMTAALPRLNVQPIPGGVIEPKAQDPIGSIIDGVTDLFTPDREEPPPSEFDRQPREGQQDPPF